MGNFFDAQLGKTVTVATPSDPHVGSELLREQYRRTTREQSLDTTRHWGLDSLQRDRMLGKSYLDYREVESMEDDEFHELFGVHPLKVLEEAERAKVTSASSAATSSSGDGDDDNDDNNNNNGKQ